MKLIDKDKIAAELEKRYEYWREKEFNSHSIESEIRMSECQHLMLLFNSIETKEANPIWNDARKTIPEDSSNQIICIKEDDLAVATVGKLVRGTKKWAYLNDLLDTSSFNVEAKDAELEKEIEDWVKIGPHTSYPWCTIPDAIRITAEHFYELGLKAKEE